MLLSVASARGRFLLFSYSINRFRVKRDEKNEQDGKPTFMEYYTDN